jgi:hypothetical protein
MTASKFHIRMHAHPFTCTECGAPSANYLHNGELEAYEVMTTCERCTTAAAMRGVATSIATEPTVREQIDTVPFDQIDAKLDDLRRIYRAAAKTHDYETTNACAKLAAALKQRQATAQRDEPVIAEPTTLLSVADVAERALALGRAFEPQDAATSPALYESACEYARHYTGTFAFMLDMQRAACTGLLTMSQAKGVLNCMRAAHEREQRVSAPATPASASVTSTTYDKSAERAVANGRYTIVFDADDESDRVTLRLRDDFRSDLSANDLERLQVASFLNGSDNESDYRSFAFVAGRTFAPFKRYRDAERVQRALALLLRDEQAMLSARTAYAVESGKCSACGRTLTVPASVHAGLGPICAKRAA